MYWAELFSPFAYSSAAPFKALAIATPQTRKKGSSMSWGRVQAGTLKVSTLVSRNMHL